jgi:murein DD-endopeptidase MepM/ murein hydrolase activator NlpD
MSLGNMTRKVLKLVLIFGMLCVITACIAKGIGMTSQSIYSETPQTLETETTSFAPSATRTYTPSPTLTPTRTETPTETITPSPTECVPPVLDLPFDPEKIIHTQFNRPNGTYDGIDWFDDDPTANYKDWRGLRSTHDGHMGTDFVLPDGTEIYAAAAGKVINGIRGDGTKGDRIEIAHGCGYYTSYQHVDPLVKIGEIVEQGQLIATTVLNPGFDPHLHFAIMTNSIPTGYTFYFDGKNAIDPMLACWWSDEALVQLESMPEVKGHHLCEK